MLGADSHIMGEALRKPPFIVLLLLPALSLIGCTPKDCLTEQELIADSAAGFLVAQEISARMCDLGFGPKGGDAPMGGLHRGITAKFKTQWAALAIAREGRYRRWYGAEWKQQMDVDGAEVTRRIVAGLRLSGTICGNLNTEMEIRHASEWAYIKAKLDFAVKRNRHKVNACK